MGESAAASHTEGVQTASFHRLLTRRVFYDKYISAAKPQTQWVLAHFSGMCRCAPWRGLIYSSHKAMPSVKSFESPCFPAHPLPTPLAGRIKFSSHCSQHVVHAGIIGLGVVDKSVL